MSDTTTYYHGQGQQQPAGAVDNLPVSNRADMARPEDYLADKGLVDACNVALMLGQPLLLTGEPGTGKTLFASSLAWELNLGDPLKFDTKSDSKARDLFYVYDALRRFRDAQAGVKDVQTIEYLTFHALGTAILRSLPEPEVEDLIPKGFGHVGSVRSVVLVDEVDKAPRDFPNDILNEMENLYFRIPEVDNRIVRAGEGLDPIVILTSNSEKDLPAPFLRRCVFYDIPFPGRDRLETIVAQRLARLQFDGEYLSDALDLFYELRGPAAGLYKKPSTAELLAWLIALQRLYPDDINPLRSGRTIDRATGALAKGAHDQQQVYGFIREWMNNRKH